MKSSPIYPKYESGDYFGYEFDPQVDFAQFLKEARTHSCEGNFEAAPPYPQESGKKQFDAGGEKNKKSWRNSLFSWLKAEKKSKLNVEPSNSSYNISKPRRGYVSGPIHGNGGGGGATGKPRRPTSGPVTGLFNSTKRMEGEIPYMCLDQLNNPHGAQSYGPVYLVT